MKVIAGADIRSAMKDVRPTHISVAYVGIDWRSYIDVAALEEIIVSPTFGTHPRALADIVNEKGWDRVHLLRDLHAKVYIGAGGSIVGSCNLTANGLHGERLEEVAVYLSPNEQRSEVESEFARLRLRAQAEFQDVGAKQRALRKLEHLWSKAIAGEFISQQDRERTVLDYIVGANDRFYVVYVAQDPSIELDDSAISGKLAVEPTDVDETIADYVTLLEDDEVEVGKWILCWWSTADGSMGGKEPYWLYVHDVVPKGQKNGHYTKVAVRRRDRRKPPAPFNEKDPAFVAALRDVLMQPAYKAFTPNGGQPWSMNPTQSLFDDFISDVKERTARPTRTLGKGWA